jgi:endogenous inhibitor of DNA gyrase (YacG/DUF329 family)
VSESTVRCPLCSEPYVFMGHYAGDQSACPDCREKARAKMHGKHQPIDNARAIVDLQRIARGGR